MRRIVITTCVASLTVMALALGSFGKVFDSTYKVSPNSKLGTAGCAVCHTGKKGGKLNLYGKDLAKVMKEAGTKKLTADLLKKVENLDSNGNAVKNVDEIKADKFPG